MIELALAEVARVAAEGEQKGGLPQFDTSTFAPQLIWLAITFIALYALMSWLIVPRVSSAIVARADRIKRDLTEADRLKSETEKALNAYETALAEARGKAGQMAKTTRDTLAAEAQKARAQAEQDAQAKLMAAEAQIDATRKAAMSEVGRIASDTAAAIVGKLAGETPSPDEIKQALGA